MSTAGKAVERQEKAKADEDVASFLDKVRRAAPVASSGQGRLVFAMDATMSRQPTWDRAMSIQGQMFDATRKAGSLAVQLVYFRGYNECQASRWVDDAGKLARLMTTVDCRGGNTQIGRVLKHVKAETAAGKVNAVIFVGDACEENVDNLCQMAGEIGMLGVPMFMFQEGNDSTAQQAFKEISRLTHGAYFKLDDSSPQVLAELLGAVAAYATGGKQALEARGSTAARALLSQLK